MKLGLSLIGNMEVKAWIIFYRIVKKTDRDDPDITAR